MFYKVLVYLIIAISLWQLSNIFIVRIIEYQAMVALFTNKGKFIKRFANTAVLFYFSEMWGLLWIVNVLSFGKTDDTSKLIENCIKNMRVFTPSYCVTLPISLCTKKWWRLLKARKPATEVTSLMKYLLVIATLNLVYLYSNAWGVIIWTLYAFYVVPKATYVVPKATYVVPKAN